MRLQVYHRTHYAYAAPARESFNEARLQPTTADGQVCDTFELKVSPTAKVKHYMDFQLNCVHLFEIADAHQELNIEATSVVSTSSSRVLPAELATTPLTGMGVCARLDRCHDHLQLSKFVDPSVAAWKLGLDVTADVADAWHAAQAVMHHIHEEFDYTPAATNVNTHMDEVLRTRRGVCQDFAHVMLGVCRALKIPARYVSGYLYNGPADQLRGAQASHAWVEVFLPELGWRGLDPTNDCQPDERYVRLAVGRDYADVSPLRGTYRGTSQRKMTVDVLVTSLEPVVAA
jgi:transglutaminase-like putative cysteine protease